MGKSKPKIEISQYFLSQHFGICAGPVDVLLDVLVKEKSILSAAQTEESIVTIANLELFGGEKKEGGVRGRMYYLPGADDQVLPDVLAQRMGRANGADCPGFRGLASLFFIGASGGGLASLVPTNKRGFYWTANTPFVPGVWAKVRRAPVGLDPAYALVPNDTVITGQVSVSWWQNTFIQTGGNDEARMGIGFLDVDGNLIGSITWAPYAQPTTWTQRTITANAPSGARRIRVYMGMRRLAGTHCDGYIDAISVTLNSQNLRLANPGAEDDVNGWTSTTGGLDAWNNTLGDPTGPSPYQGAFYFAGGFNAATEAYQDTAGGADANPAHIIYECLTNRDWGMGTPEAALDTAAFEAVAITLFNEGFGLSMIWTRQSEIQKFINEVLDHIQAVIFTDPRTGLLTIKLIRDDYDPDTLPVIDPDSADLSGFSRKLWGDIVNEIVVTWTNPENEQEETITAQDNASISVQGGVVSDSRNYYGVRSAALAQQLAFRDLRSAGQPLASCEAVVDRSQYDLRPGSVVKLTWPEYGLTELVMRVQSIDYGRPGDPEIKISMVEDVYGVDIGSYDTAPGSSWVDPSAPPTDMDPVNLLTLPYFMAVNSELVADLGEITYPSVVAGILASTSNADAWEFDVLDEVALASGDLEEQVIETNNVIGYATTSAQIVREAETTLVSFDNLIGNTTPALSGFVILGNGTEATSEIAMITADNGDETYTLARGVMDTVPRDWPAGTPAFFVDESTIFEDALLRSAGEVYDVKLLPRTSQGTLDASAATLQSTTLTERPYLPLRPADVQIDGQAFSSEAEPFDQTDAYVDIPITWANRNRITEDSQILRWDDATVTPETGQTTTIEVRRLDGTLITAHTGLTGTSFDLPLTSFGSASIAEVRVLAERTDGDGTFESLQYWSEWVRVAGELRITEDNFDRITEADEARITED